MLDEREASAPDEATRVDGSASTPSSKLAPGAALAPRRVAVDDWLKDQISSFVGPKLGRYALLRVLGEGGMGVVFAAYDEELDRKVAIKLLRTPSAGRHLDRSVLLREARAMARLNHPNIVQVYDVGEIEDQLFVAMEFVAGVSLHAWFRGGRRSWREVLAVLVQAGRGLEAAHEAGLIHCDFKPANVLVGKDGRTRVLDFGLAQLHGRTRGPDEGGDSRAAEVTGGTPAYMAPEIYLADTHDARSDLFAFSVALYEGLHGQRPFVGKSRDELRSAICTGVIAAPTAGASVPVWVRDAVLRGLATDPARRWPSMQALLAELERDPTRVRRRRAVAGGLVAALALGSLAAWHWRKSETAAVLETCRAPEVGAARLLAPERREAMREAFAATGLPYAERGADTVEAALAAFVHDWTAIHAAACEDAVIRGKLAPDMMTLRDRCAARQLAEVSATVEVLVEADAAVVDNIGNLAAELPNPARCQELRVLAALADDDAEKNLAPHREVLRARLARVNVEIAAGHFERAQELVAPLLGETEPMLDRALRAEILEAAAASADALGDLDRAEELELRGFADALASDHVRFAALFAVSRTFREAGHGRLVEGRRWSQIADGLIDRADDDGLRFNLLIHLGGIASTDRDYPESLAIYERALELAARTRVATSGMWALHNNRGVTLNYLGRHAEAVAAYERAIDVVRETYGDEHPDIAATYLNIATVHSFAGELEAAIRKLKAAAEMQGRLLGEAHPALVLTLQNLASVEQEAGALEDAHAHATRAVAILDSAGQGADDLLAGYVASVLGEIERRRGLIDVAAQQCTKSLAILEHHLGPSHFHLMYPLTCLGEVARARGGLDSAEALLERALGLLDERADVTHADRGHVRLVLAQTLAARHEDGRARDLADQAIASFAAAGPSYSPRHRDAVAWRRSLDEARVNTASPTVGTRRRR